jgi:hydroxyneurosporene synthase CrtC
MSTQITPNSLFLPRGDNVTNVLQFDPIRDLAAHYGTDGDSFYMLSYVSDGENDFTVLFHQLLIYKSPLGPVAQLVISSFNDTTKGDYHFGEVTYFLKEMENEPSSVVVSSTHTIDRTIVDIVMPEGRLSGTNDEMHVEGHVDDMIGLSMKMVHRGPIIPNLVTGVIPFSGDINWEYALPSMETKGTLTVAGRTRSVTGVSWFDRQWGRFGAYKWTWMNI